MKVSPHVGVLQVPDSLKNGEHVDNFVEQLAAGVEKGSSGKPVF